METEVPLPYSQMPATCPKPEPAISYQSIIPGPRLSVWTIRMIRFYGEELAPRPTPPPPRARAGGPPLVGCPRLII